MLSRRSRFAAPFVVSGLIALGALAPTLRASASPDLPSITPHQLIVKVLDQHVAALSGSVEWKADLGLPSLSGLTGGNGQSVSSSTGFDPTSLLSGEHDFTFWTAAGMLRIAAPGTLSETDVVQRGSQAWLYDSSTDHVTHYVRAAGARTAPSQPLEAVSVTAVADNLLQRVDSIGTAVTVTPAVEVAGRPAYELRLAPDRTIAANRASTVSSVTISVDARTGLPLRVSVDAVGESSPALEVGYSSISYATPSASIFAVPHGQTTSTKVLKAVDADRTSPSASPVRSWAAIANLPSRSDMAMTAEVDSISTVVSGTWGSGRLVTSTLVNALFLDNGRVLTGLVTPAALEAAAGQLFR